MSIFMLEIVLVLSIYKSKNIMAEISTFWCFLTFSLIMMTNCEDGGMEKPGKCLPWNGGGPCIVSCQHDWTCNGPQKCCPVGCGRMCQNPCSTSCDGISCNEGNQCIVYGGCAQCIARQGTTSLPSRVCNGTCADMHCDVGKECKIIAHCAQCVSSSKEKPGKCSKWQGDMPCLKNCERDFDCPSTKKCCTVGCGKICSDPCATDCDSLPPCFAGYICKIIDSCAECVTEHELTPDPGRPVNVPSPSNSGVTNIDNKDMTGTKSNVCSGTCNDVTCTDGKECKIVNHCALCVSSDKEKPGKCIKWQGDMPCLKNCEKDFDCPSTRKCCSMGCGKICSDPCPTECKSLPPCLAGNICSIVDGCAECIKENDSMPTPSVFVPATPVGGNSVTTTTFVIESSDLKQNICSGVCNDMKCPDGKECKTVNHCAQCVSSDKTKPGKCSKWQGNMPCLKNCEKDYDCPTTRKCCSMGCGKICSDPCATECQSLPPCLAGTVCKVIDGCADCFDINSSSKHTSK